MHGERTSVNPKLRDVITEQKKKKKTNVIAFRRIGNKCQQIVYTFVKNSVSKCLFVGIC